MEDQDHSVNQSRKHSSGERELSPRPAQDSCFYCGKTHGADDHCDNDDVIFFDESPEVLRKGFNK